MTVKTLISLGKETLNFDYKRDSGLIPGLTFSNASSNSTHTYAYSSRIGITSIEQFIGVDGIVFSGLSKNLVENEFGIETVDSNAYYIFRIIDSTSRGHGDTADGVTYQAWQWNLNNPPTGNVSITGVAEQNQKLTADTTTLADVDGLGTVSYQWLSYGSPISGATQNTYTVAMNDLYANISVAASYTDGLGKVESVASPAVTIARPQNFLPTGSVTISGEAAQGRTLSLYASITDFDGIGDFSYQWLRDGIAINNANQLTYTLTAVDVGKAISVKASYTDLQNHAESMTSSSTQLVVIPTNSAPTGSVTVYGTATQNQSLTVNNTLADADGLGTVSYQWLSEGVVITGANQTTYALTQTDVGKNISVSTSYTDGLGKLENVTSNVVKIANVNDAPTGAVLITGTTTQGQVLTASNSLADLDGLGSISYQWLNSGLPISGANQAAYTLTTADVGKAISVKASYTDLQNMAESVTSSPTAAVIATVSTQPNNSNNQITGTTKNDKLIGTVKNDTLNSLDGNDTLTGGFGFDELTGGAGADNFVYKSIKDMPVSHSKIEIITDFSHSDGDKIDLSAIDADTSKAKNQAFSKPEIGAEFSGVFTKAGQLFFDTTDHILYGSVNKDSSANFAIQLSGVSSLVVEDFVL